MTGAVPVLGASAVLLNSQGVLTGGAAARAAEHSGHEMDGAGGGHAGFRDGATVDHAANGFDPSDIVRDFDWGTTSRMAGGRRKTRAAS